MDGKTQTTAEFAEDAVLPRSGEVHASAAQRDNGGTTKDMEKLKKAAAGKSPAQWAYERLILYIQKFEEQLDNAHEVAMGFSGGDAGVLRIEGLGFFDPDIITFYGTDETGARTQQICHVSQLNVMLRAMPRRNEEGMPARIGFRLAEGLEKG